MLTPIHLTTAAPAAAAAAASGRKRSLLAARKNPAAPAAPSPSSPEDDDSCKALVTSFSLSPISVPSPKEFEQLPDAINGGAVAAELRKRGYAVQTVHIADLKVDNVLLDSRGGNANLPAGATGKQTVQFTLRLMGPDAVLGNGGLLRVLMQDGIATQLAAGSSARGGSAEVEDAVSVTNVKLVRDPGDTGSKRRRRRSSSRKLMQHLQRSLLLLEGAPPAGSPERADAVAKASAETAADAATVKVVAAAAAAPTGGNETTTAATTATVATTAKPSSPAPSAPATTTPIPYQFDYAAATEPTIDVTAMITHLSPDGVKRVYSDVNTLTETNQFTNLLKAAGYRIDSVRAAPVAGWFLVDGKPYGSRSSLVERAQAGDARPLARAIVIPLLVLGILAVLACFLCSLRRRQLDSDREAGIYYRSAGWWPRFLGGSSLPRSTGLDVAAAVRKAGGPVSAAELLLRDIESGGKAASAAPGNSGGSGSSGLQGAFAASAGNGGGSGGGGANGDGGGGGGGGSDGRSGCTALPADRASSQMDDSASNAASAFLDDYPYGRLARGWQLDPASLQILTKPDGSEWELGSGTSGRVYKALYNGVQEVAVKVFNDALPSLAALAEEGERESASEEVGRKASAASSGGGGGGGGGARKTAAGLKNAFRAAMAFRSSRSSGSGKRSASGGGGEGTAAAEDENKAAAAVVSPPSSLGTEAPATNSASSSSTTKKATSTTVTATDISSAPAGGLAAAPSKGAGISTPSTLKKPPLPLSKQRAAAKQQLEDLAREVLLLRACHDRNVVSFVGASVHSGHAVLVTVRFLLCVEFCVLRE